MFSPNCRAFSNASSLCCIGAECTLADVPEKLNKGYSAEETRKQYLRLNALAIRHCDLLMLGTAGKGSGLECAATTDFSTIKHPEQIGDLLRNSYFFRLSGIWCSQGTLVWQRPQP